MTNTTTDAIRQHLIKALPMKGFIARFTIRDATDETPTRVKVEYIPEADYRACDAMVWHAEAKTIAVWGESPLTSTRSRA